MTYNAEGKRITSENLAGQVTTTAWDCCLAYSYNNRGELTNAVAAVDSNYRHAYAYDDIGNRESSSERGTNSVYTASQLNQYTSISNLCDSASLREAFTPQFDDDGNQTLVQTATGICSVTYNGENRPVAWSCGVTNIVMSFDRMGRRVEYVETVKSDAGGLQFLVTATNTHHCFVYDGYLCIQRLNAAANNAIDLIFAWGPTERVATRPLMIVKPNVSMLYVTHDGNKNVSDIIFFSSGSGVAGHCEYTPFGELSASTRNSSSVAYDFCIYNPFRFSSEYMDDSLVLVYYNYRHYYPRHGSWTSRDPIEYEPFEKVHAIGTMMNSINVYRYCKNATLMSFDYLGLLRDCDAEQIMCYRLCWNTNPPWPIDKHKRGHHIYCTSKCLAEYMKCQAENEFETIASAIFECIDEAIKWVNDNKVLVGTLVVVGGVAYVVSTSGVGALILVPLL